MTISGRQQALRLCTIVVLTIATAVALPPVLAAGSENLSSETAAVTAPPADGLVNTVDKGAGTTTGTIQQVGNGTPLQPVTNTISNTAQKTVTGATGMLRQPASPAPALVSSPPPAPAPAPAPFAGTPMAAALSDMSTLTPGSASGLRVYAATLLLANDTSFAPLVAEALSAAPSALVLVAEPLARSLNLPLAPPDAPTLEHQVQPVRILPQGLLAEALIAVALLVAATAALVAELGLKRSTPRAT
ncbi:MAG: hypothetical protein ABR592_06985 [Nitriliruptorales bacterium]